MKSAAVDFRAVLPHAEEESLTQKVTLLSSVSDPVFFSRDPDRPFFPESGSGSAKNPDTDS